MNREKPHIVWRETPPPPDMPVTQAYTWALDPDDGRVLLQDRGMDLEPGCRRYNLPGGRPEPEDDGDPLKTAAREALEESQIHLDTTRAVYLGYQEITEDPYRPGPYAQLRYAAPIIGYDPIGPDPDTADGRVNRRYLVSLERAPELLGWGEHGVAQAEAAFRAGQKLGFPVESPAPDGYRDA
ncbi:NUDIX hydrolase [Catenulispora sp. NL8]|uniref:NUDIX hydrolase n=1 Tax=Catenulispora pinistramenti TaxID=2705254 RepID=A0ABS5KJR0_9ACTN|nr:NUDIX hydrolase [Catenulispora pinistramenti]MBS2546285.1 NUDIX hydrolase [Catenulispora pinistramenti]